MTNPRIAIFIRGHGIEDVDDSKILSTPINTVISKMPRVGSLLYDYDTCTKPTGNYIEELQDMYQTSIKDGILHFITKQEQERVQYEKDYQTSYEKFTQLYPLSKSEFYLPYHKEAFKDTLQIRSFRHNKNFYFYDENNGDVGAASVNDESDVASPAPVFNPAYGIFIIKIYDYNTFDQEKGMPINIMTFEGLTKFVSLFKDKKNKDKIEKSGLYMALANYNVQRSTSLYSILTFFKNLSCNHVHIIDQTCRSISFNDFPEQQSFELPQYYPLLRQISTKEKEAGLSVYDTSLFGKMKKIKKHKKSNNKKSQKTKSLYRRRST